MNVRVPHDFKVNEVIAPPSKSYAQRAILAAALSQQWSEIRNIGNSDDVLNILNIAKQLGAQIEQNDSLVRIKGTLNPLFRTLNCGESGLGVRLTIPIAATFGGEFVLSGEGSLMQRSMDLFEKILPALGVEIETNDGKLPVRIKGRLQGAALEGDGSHSSQYFSGLLMALPLAENDSMLKINNLASGPYIDITLDVLSMFGIMIPFVDGVYYIRGNQKYQPAEFMVEGDWSGAAFWVVYGAICNEILIDDINMFSSQADIAILEVLTAAGINYEWLDEGLQVRPTVVQSFQIDAHDCPDLFPALVVLAAAAQGTSTIKGVNRLKNKESDRGIVLQQEFAKLGLKIELNGNDMIIDGTGSLKSGTIDSHNDHRIAMAGAIAAILTDDYVEIINAEAVNKSYPGFWKEIFPD